MYIRALLSLSLSLSYFEVSPVWSTRKFLLLFGNTVIYYYEVRIFLGARRLRDCQQPTEEVGIFLVVVYI